MRGKSVNLLILTSRENYDQEGFNPTWNQLRLN